MVTVKLPHIAALSLFCVTLALVPRPGCAASLIGDIPPDLSPCQSGGWQNVLSDLFLAFPNESACLDYAGLGGAFNPISGGPHSADDAFFITNRTSSPLQIEVIHIADSFDADDITFGKTPADFPAGTLADPLTKPNFPINSVLKLKFHDPTIEYKSAVAWFIYFGPKGKSRLTFIVQNQSGPGWRTQCALEQNLDCTVSGDGVHATIVDRRSSTRLGELGKP
jgi:hypothetical protein